MRIYLKNNPAKFHPDPIWNDGALGFFEEITPNKKNKRTSVSGLKGRDKQLQRSVEHIQFKHSHVM